MKNFKHNFIALLSLLAFITQVVSANEMTCKAHQKNPLQISQSHDMSNHHMMTLTNTETKAMDCCDESCQCPDKMCITPILILTTSNMSILPHIQLEHWYSHTIITSQKQISAIFHPPIYS